MFLNDLKCMQGVTKPAFYVFQGKTVFCIKGKTIYL